MTQYVFSLWKFILAAVLVFVFAVFNGYFLAQNSPLETELILKKLQEVLGPIVEMPLLGQFLFIVLNNGITVFLVIVLGIIFGIFPFLVLFSNGTILGVIAFFSKTELSWSTFFVGILPHGIIEIPVVILACAIGFKLGKTLFIELFLPSFRVAKAKVEKKESSSTIKTKMKKRFISLPDRVFKNRAPQQRGEVKEDKSSFPSFVATRIGEEEDEVLFAKEKEADIKTELNTALAFFIKVLFPLLLLAAAVEIFITSQLL